MQPGWQAAPQPWDPGNPTGQPQPPPIEPTPGTVHGIPFDKRGHIAIETASFTRAQGDPSLMAIGLDAHMPLGSRFFADARVPFGAANGIFSGNIMLGGSKVLGLDPRGFLTLSGQLGIPLQTSRPVQQFSLPNGTWNMFEYQGTFMPIKLGLGYERMFGKSLEGRLDLEPILSIPIGKHGYNAGFTFQHAVELQYGHSIGAGIRLQGVAVTDQLQKDPYQFSIEPFAVVRKEMGFARLGLLMPLADTWSGPAFKQAWGLRVWAGIHID